MMMLIGVLGTFVCLFLILLSRRLRAAHPAANPQPVLSDVQLGEVSYHDIDMLKAIPSQPTLENYVVIGGSGFLGMYIVRLLILRGETKIRVLDLHPPHPDIASNPSVSYIKTDVTSLQSVRDGLTQPFSDGSGLPTVIYHTAAIIRFWERASYTWETSYNVNVQGTANVLSVAKKMPNTILVYTSTADTCIPRSKFLRLGLDYKIPPYHKVTISDDDSPLKPSQSSQSCYTRSKLLAEQLVIGANGWNGLKTGIIRPGCTIMGPNDRILASTLTMARVPVFDKVWSATNVCVWDVAAAHLLHEDALRRNPEESAGQAFLISGKGPAWRLNDIRNAVKYYSSRPLLFDEVPPLLVYILAHFVEFLLFIRYYALLPFYVLRGSKLRLYPEWMGQLVYMQPSTLEYMRDIVIDDSRAQKILGYRPQWSTVQCIRYTVDEMQSGRAREGHGLQLKSD
ncbi:hypothetical protein PILCRDRAFT_218982 [Piloderma croceum F 1598]|uniref:3-beta hydroxysteroid dehydrogenase/isomerase domain-containing protein n=1 Tax=Piloderma croceum (strain F 1598) TaxID=765440 RepID=A0A0C3GC03_PILCF|nr:hypothetical protein PILCRDRAFT_218982 [Piloderma croceum F 1598]